MAIWREERSGSASRTIQMHVVPEPQRLQGTQLDRHGRPVCFEAYYSQCSSPAQSVPRDLESSAVALAQEPIRGPRRLHLAALGASGLRLRGPCERSKCTCEAACVANRRRKSAAVIEPAMGPPIWFTSAILVEQAGIGRPERKAPDGVVHGNPQRAIAAASSSSSVKNAGRSGPRATRRTGQRRGNPPRARGSLRPRAPGRRPG